MKTVFLSVCASLLMLTGLLFGLGQVFPQNQILLTVPTGNTPALTQESKETVKAPASVPAQIPALSASAGQSQKRERERGIDVLTLGLKNTLVFRGPVTDDSVSKIQRKILDMSYSLKSSDVIYLVIDSPGGSIAAGNMLIDTVKALPQKVKTVTIFSASMAFHMVEAFDERLILPSGTLMSHRASLGGVGGEIGGDGKGELATRMNWIVRQLQVMDAQVAARMGMSVKDYQELIRDEYWVDGQDSVDAKAADRVVLARCGKDMLQGTEPMEIRTFFGILKLEFSKCPLISYPVKVDMSAMTFRNEEDRKFVDLMIGNKEQFVKSYIKDNSFERFVRP